MNNIRSARIFQFLSRGKSQKENSTEQRASVLLLVRHPELFCCCFLSNTGVTISTERLHCANTCFFGLVHHHQKKTSPVSLHWRYFLLPIYRTFKWKDRKESASQVRLCAWQCNYKRKADPHCNILHCTTLRLSDIARNWLLSLVQCVWSISIVGDTPQSGCSCWSVTVTLSALKCFIGTGRKEVLRSRPAGSR